VSACEGVDGCERMCYGVWECVKVYESVCVRVCEGV